MTNNDKIMEPPCINHPWVSPPQTIGSLATMNVSLLFMREIAKGEVGYQIQEERMQNNLIKFQQLMGVEKVKANLTHHVIPLFILFYL
jgi:hypothetical protein